MFIEISIACQYLIICENFAKFSKKNIPFASSRNKLSIVLPGDTAICLLCTMIAVKSVVVAFFLGQKTKEQTI